MNVTKSIPYALSIALVLTVRGSVLAGSTAQTFPVSVTIVPGVTMDAYLVGNDVVTTVRNVERAAPPAPNGAVPIARLGFEGDASQSIMKVTWDKQRHRLTIDF